MITDYFEYIQTTTTVYHDICFRNQIKRERGKILDEFDSKNKKICIYKMEENIYDKVNRLDKEIKDLREDVTELKTIENSIDTKHILGECISNYLVAGINKREEENYDSWTKIPSSIYLKYNIDKNELWKLKQERDKECHPRRIDINKLIVHYTNPSRDIKELILVRNIVNVFYDFERCRFRS